MADARADRRARLPAVIVVGDSDDNDGHGGGTHPLPQVRQTTYAQAAQPTQEHRDTHPYEMDPLDGSGRGNRPRLGERFWYHPTDLVNDQAKTVRKSRMGVEIGYLEHAGNGPHSEGSLHLVMFPGREMQLKIAYNGSSPLQTIAWGYNEQHFSVYPPDDPRHRVLTADDSIDTGDLSCCQAQPIHNGAQPSGVAFLLKHWHQMWLEGGWNGVKLGAQRVCMARMRGRWVYQTNRVMVTECAYRLDGRMDGWREV